MCTLCVCVCLHSVAAVTAISFQKKSLSYVLLVNPGNLFSVGQESGTLSLTRPLDYESGHNLHLLQVRASESDTGLTAVAEVCITVNEQPDSWSQTGSLTPLEPARCVNTCI